MSGERKVSDVRPIVVLHVLDDLETGGSERQVTAFVLRSDARRFHHEVCVLFEGGRFASELDAAGIPIHVFGTKPNTQLIRSAGQLWRLVKKIRPDVLHATLYRPGLVSRVVGKLCGIPVVTTLVNPTYEPEWRVDNPRLTPYKVWIVQTVDRLTSRWAGAYFISVNNSVKASAVRQLGLAGDRIAVIPRGIAFDKLVEPPDNEVAAVRRSLGWDGTYPVLLNVGRLVPQKGQRYAIRAMPHILARFPDARLAIAGEGGLRSELSTLIESLGLERHVTLLGERHDVNVLLRAADILVMPSLFEGAANALLEAMTAGKPSVVSDIPSLREGTRDGAFALLARIQTPEDLGAKVLRLAEDRDFAQQMGRAARDWVRTHYDLQPSVVALEAFYRRLVDGAGVEAEAGG